MINIFSRLNKELASWVAICRFLRGLDRYGANFYKGMNIPHQGANHNQDLIIHYRKEHPDEAKNINSGINIR
ncbi:MAG: hypothetical protein ACREXR_20915 [Gammaproteobacteria bacterium]